MAVPVGVSLMPQTGFAEAVLPLFLDGLIDVVEWSFDQAWSVNGLPKWLAGILDDYGDAGRLLGHGVSFSLQSQHRRQDQWLGQLSDELSQRPYCHVSEHLGFMAVGRYNRSAPLPMPYTPEFVDIAVGNAHRIAERSGSPIGIENLATALAVDDVISQGPMLSQILARTQGWLVLDLHNLWCQAVNAGLDAAELAETYPLQRVRELHLSGGSWWSPPGSQRRIRRDTHDGPIPPELFDLIAVMLGRCPSIEAVIVERLGTTFDEPGAGASFRDDVLRVRAACESHR